MKFRCTSNVTVLASVNGELRTVSPGEVIESDRKPKGDFVLVEEAPKAKAVKKAVKKTTKKVTENADSTETSSVW